MTLALDHIQIAIPKGGEDLCRAFWGDLIGLREIAKPKPLQARGGLWFALAGSELHLGVEHPFAPAQKAHPGFRTSNIAALAARFETAGHALTWDVAMEGRKRFFATDPFGNRLEFLQDNDPVSSF
ncbi:glyoxalase [Parasedimentitalea marina]|uniref:Glyoxalase n=1 Tax=Parasedimentitalea marina TaxID=2483033 RepID=A0A3T0MXS6_9RHOB|nr:glyoxalase [Parasedimentitalea marina]AZV76563.1 glyoxalase [Parasedimentitalea marina]